MTLTEDQRQAEWRRLASLRGQVAGPEGQWLSLFQYGMYSESVVFAKPSQDIAEAIEAHLARERGGT